MLRMLKFYPEQVARHWEKIGFAIERSLPPIAITSKANERMNGILESILVGKLEVHVFATYEDRVPIVYAIAVTAIINPVDNNGKELLIYSVFASRQLSREILFEGLELFRKYAKGQGCNAISAYTNVEGLKMLFERVGGSSSFSYLRLEV